MPVSKNNKKKRSHKQWKRKMNIQRSETRIVAKRDRQRQIVKSVLNDDMRQKIGNVMSGIKKVKKDV